MKYIFLIFIIIVGANSATQLTTSDGLQGLFVRLLKKELDESEYKSVQNLIEILYLPVKDLTDNVSNSADRSSLTCFVCRSAFAALTDLIEVGITDNEIIDAIYVLCDSLSIMSSRVCHGALLLNVPILTYIIKTTPEAVPSTICGIFFQNVQKDNNCQFNDDRFEWQVELPPPSETIIPNISNNAPVTIAIISDAHIDPLYEPYGVADCTDPTCCRSGQTPNTYAYNPDTDNEILINTLKEVDGQQMIDLDAGETLRNLRNANLAKSFRNSPPAGFWGDYRQCDTPVWAYEDAIDRIASTHKDVDYIYYLGDTIDHHVWETTYELINKVNFDLVDIIKKSFGENVTVIPVIGNHESQPTNQFAPIRVTGKYLNTTWLYDALAEKWDSYLSEEAKASVRERGGFSQLLRPGLRVISVNNNVAYKNNWWLVYDPLDSKTHLDWLVSELYKAEQAGEKVHILAHIPPGVHDLIYTWTREYNRIVNRFADTIAAEFNGHTHSDEFKIFYSSQDNKTPISIAWGAGSLTAYINYNPNYKIATFNTTTYEPTNIINYIYNLTEANLTPNRRPHWFQLYNVKNTFAINDLTPNTMNDLVYSMVTDNRHLLDLYSAFFSKLSDKRWPYCGDYCKIDNLCKVVVTVLWEREKCEELRRLFFS